MSTSWCSIPRCTPTPEGRPQSRRPSGAVAKFAASGKETAKKDLGAFARSYGNVYVAQIALGGNEMQAVRALREAAGVAWSVAGDRLQHLHRARYRDVDVNDAPEGRCGVWLLAAVPLPPEPARGRASVPARFEAADDSRSRISRWLRRDSRCSPVPIRSARGTCWPWLSRTSRNAGTTTSSLPTSSAPCHTTTARRQRLQRTMQTKETRRDRSCSVVTWACRFARRSSHRRAR